MNVLEGIDGMRQLPAGAVISIGNFDGVHLGHQHLLAHARELKASTGAAELAVITFEPHPFSVLRPKDVPPRLTPPCAKRELLGRAGVDSIVVLPPSREVLDLTAEEFWRILRDDIRPSYLIEGSTFTFGKGRGGTIDRLREWTTTGHIRLHVMPAVEVALLNMHVVPASSSIIRWLLAGGRVRDAAICLGRAYTIEGRVIHGAARGRELGVPTANLQCDEQLIPADGVYAGRCAAAGRTWAAAVSIGTNPTFGDNPRTIEAHLIGFDGDLYDQTLRLELLDWQRDQRTFAGVEILKQWIARDVEGTLARAGDDPSQPLVATEATNGIP